PPLAEAPPAGATGAGRAVANHARTHVLDGGVVTIGRPVALKILQKSGPIVRELVSLEVRVRKREAEVHPNQGGALLAQPFNEPLRNPPARPVLQTARRRAHFGGGRRSRGNVHSQPLQACRRRAGTRVVDANVPIEGRHAIYGWQLALGLGRISW